MSHPNNKISKFVNKFYRILLGVPSYTSTIGVHMELGRFPIDTNVYSAMLKYWTRLITLPKSHFVSHCYWSLQSNPATAAADPWLNSVKNIIFSTGQYQIWNNQSDLGSMGLNFARRPQMYMCQNLRDQFIQEAPQKMGAESKLKFFKNSKDTFGVSNYLTTIKNRKSRTLLAKLRLGVLPLEIEKGRRNNIAREERFCKFCNCEKIEDEVHFLFECSFFENHRTGHISRLSHSLPMLGQYDNSQKLKFLYFNHKTPINALETACHLLVKLIDARDAAPKV
jgi:hypothetical protein